MHDWTHCFTVSYIQHPIRLCFLRLSVEPTLSLLHAHIHTQNEEYAPSLSLCLAMGVLNNYAADQSARFGIHDASVTQRPVTCVPMTDSFLLCGLF